jgi:hypothetical protein
MNRCDTWIIEQRAAAPVEHTVEEASEKSGATSPSSLRREVGMDTDLTLVNPLLGGFSKAG